MHEHFKRAIDDQFTRLGVSCTYKPANGVAKTVTAIVNDRVEESEIGQSRIIVYRARFDIRRCEIDDPGEGDTITHDSTTYKVMSEPTSCLHQLVWLIGVYRT